MAFEEVKHHEQLFSGPSYQLGKIHWYILRAYWDMEQRSEVNQKGKWGEDIDVTTPFGNEVGTDEIHWWIFKKETNLEELLNKTKETLVAVQKLKEGSLTLKSKFFPKSYENLVQGIKTFSEQHTSEIQSLYEYVTWLYSKDELAPIILFTFRVWGSTRLSDRIITKVSARNPDIDEQKVKWFTETALGLRDRHGITIGAVHNDIAADIYDASDGENWPVGDPVPPDQLLTRTSHTTLNELAVYFEFIRNSLNNIIIDVEKYKDQFRLLHNQRFLSDFVHKAAAAGKIETQLWDFKKTFEMWECGAPVKTEKEIDFVEHVASYANSNGGVLIVGITDDNPRRITGLNDLENKVKAAKTMIDRYTDNGIPTVFQQVTLKDNANKDCNCLLIFIAQTKHVAYVKDQQGKLSYTIRQGTGRGRSTPEVIQAAKNQLLYDNYNFVSALDSFTRSA